MNPLSLECRGSFFTTIVFIPRKKGAWLCHLPANLRCINCAHGLRKRRGWKAITAAGRRRTAPWIERGVTRHRGGTPTGVGLAHRENDHQFSIVKGGAHRGVRLILGSDSCPNVHRRFCWILKYFSVVTLYTAAKRFGHAPEKRKLHLQFIQQSREGQQR